MQSASTTSLCKVIVRYGERVVGLPAGAVRDARPTGISRLTVTSVIMAVLIQKEWLCATYPFCRFPDTALVRRLQVSTTIALLAQSVQQVNLVVKAAEIVHIAEEGFNLGNNAFRMERVG